MMLLFYLLAFVVVLSTIVVVHEGGHFFAARRCGVQVTAFSIGFGKKLWSRKDKKGTEWRICAIPLGGYVQMLGDDDPSSGIKTKGKLSPEEEKKTFYAQPVWKRAIIIFAGPFMNYVLAVAIFWGVFSTVGNYSTIVKDVAPDTAAAYVGLQKADELVSVQDLEFVDFFRRENILLLAKRKPDDSEEIPNIIHKIVPKSLAEKAGLQDEDKIIAINGKDVTNFAEIKDALKDEAGTGRELHIKVERNGEVLEFISQPLEKKGRNSKLGIISVSLALTKEPPLLKIKRNGQEFDLPVQLPAIVGKVLPDTMAERAGIKKGDIILVINNYRIISFDEILTGLLMLVPNEKVTIKVKRGKEILDLDGGIFTEKEDNDNRKLGVVADGFVDLVPKNYNPIEALSNAVKKVSELNSLLIKALGKMITGKSKASEISGPVGIAEASGDAAKGGPLSFISFIGMVSICIGFFNLLPIPILDGGHLFLLACEAIFRKPLPEKTQILLMRIGLSLLMTLVVFTLFNDIPRVISRMFGF